MTFSRETLVLIALGLAVATYALLPRSARAGGSRSAFHPPVRNAGPEAMTLPVRRRWDLVDEAADESFPASDPPGTY